MISKIDTRNRGPLAALIVFLKDLMRSGEIDALLAPRKLPMKNRIMPALVSDPDYMTEIDPLTPAFPLNAAKIVSRLTRKPAGGKWAAILRPCEIRAFIELVKLNQGVREEVILIGVDCLGALTNTDYLRWVALHPDADGDMFCRHFIDGKSGEEAFQPAAACKVCEQPIPEAADILIGLLGLDPWDHLLVEFRTPASADLAARMKLSETEMPDARLKAVSDLIERRTAKRNEMMDQTGRSVDSIEKLSRYLADCVNCYNCRVACPVCYCKECVFTTDVFNHEPARYLQWVKRKGAVKMPTDTIFYHLTRLAHMSTACVGCGQCSNACPNGISVMELFRTVAHHTQRAFEYCAGRDPAEKPPLSVFKENEFPEVMGI